MVCDDRNSGAAAVGVGVTGGNRIPSSKPGMLSPIAKFAADRFWRVPYTPSPTGNSDKAASFARVSSLICASLLRCARGKLQTVCLSLGL
jgi:hypothetical protein